MYDPPSGPMRLFAIPRWGVDVVGGRLHNERQYENFNLGRAVLSETKTEVRSPPILVRDWKSECKMSTGVKQLLQRFLVNDAIGNETVFRLEIYDDGLRERTEIPIIKDVISEFPKSNLDLFDI